MLLHEDYSNEQLNNVKCVFKVTSKACVVVYRIVVLTSVRNSSSHHDDMSLESRLLAACG